MFIGYGDKEESNGIRIGDRARLKDRDLVEGVVIGIHAARENTFFDEDDNEILEDVLELRTHVHRREMFPVSWLEKLPPGALSQGQMSMEL